MSKHYNVARWQLPEARSSGFHDLFMADMHRMHMAKITIILLTQGNALNFCFCCSHFMSFSSKECPKQCLFEGRQCTGIGPDCVLV